MRIEAWRIYQVLSLLAALTLSAWPLPDLYAPWQPQWVLMILIFWIIVQPGKVGFGMAWTAGLLSDLIAGNWIGIHVFSYCIIAFLCLRFYRVLQLSSPLQKLFPIGALLVLHMGYLHLFSIFLSSIDPGLLHWAGLLTSLLVWPILYHLLCKIPVGEGQIMYGEPG